MKLDSPPANMHLFMQGTHEDILRLLITDEYFPKVEAAVTKITEELLTKRSKIEADFPSASEYGCSINQKYARDL